MDSGERQGSASNSKTKKWLPLLPALLVFVILLVRNLIFWNEYSVDVLFWDQWDFWIHMFGDESSWWEMFNHQHGPHKMGVGYFFLWAVAESTNWNLRTESLVLIITMGVTSVLFLFLKWRLLHRWDWMDAFVPLACLSFGHYEIYFTSTNPGLNVVPLFLIACIGLVMTIRSEYLRLGLLVVLGFLATYTGFAIFAGLLIPVYCVAAAIREYRASKLSLSFGTAVVATILSGIGFWSFFWIYRFFPAVPDFRFPHFPLSDYALFLSQYWVHFFNLGTSVFWSVVLPLTLCFAIAWVIMRSLLASPENRSKNDVIAFLVLFSFLYSVNVAVGRVSLGVGGGRVSRYLVFLVPMWIGIYFALLDLVRWKRWVPGLALIALGLFGDWTFQKSREPNIVRLYDRKRAWVDAYAESGSIVKANQISGGVVYPFEWAYPQQQKYLDWMEANGVGFVSRPPVSEKK